jgi:adenylylsulfate kinase
MKNNLIPMTIWLYGLSAAGKSTLGEILFDWLLKRGYENIELLDGEFLRSKLDRKYGYTLDEVVVYEENIAKIASSANSERGNHAIVCSMTHLESLRVFARSQIENLYEIYLECDVPTCQNREYKDRYSRALIGEYKFLPGITDPFEPPDNPDLVINTSRLGVIEASGKLLDFFKVFF